VLQLAVLEWTERESRQSSSAHQVTENQRAGRSLFPSLTEDNLTLFVAKDQKAGRGYSI
jgi:hypothetical protein